MQSVTFTVAVLPADESALKTHGGVTNGLVLEHASGVGTPLLTKVTSGALINVALFIDASKAATASLAEEKDWWCVLSACSCCNPVPFQGSCNHPLQNQQHQHLARSSSCMIQPAVLQENL